MRTFESFDENRDRANPKKVEELFNFLWPNRAIRAACAKRLARSIQCAHEAGDASWEVTAFDWGIHLNVGQVCVLRLDSDGALVYFRKARGKSVYNAVRVPCDSDWYPLGKIATLPQTVWRRHESFIRAAAKAKKISPFKKSFSKGVLTHLESILDIDLPRPAYLKNSFKGDSQSVRANQYMFQLPDEVRGRGIYEGAQQQVYVNRYERSPKARRACIKYYGHRCMVCETDFEQAYGPIGRGYIHVHHTVPLSDIGARYKVGPVRDLRPVCPNCHAMLHREEPALSIRELQRRRPGKGR
jgi:hypothetical protein